VLKEVIELQYPSNYQVRRTVVLFRCDWYNQVGKTVGLRDDKHFKSINVQSFWYKTDPFILADQAKKIFYLQDTTPQCKDWRVVQKFEHRNIYDVAETEEGSHDVHQDDYCSEIRTTSPVDYMSNAQWRDLIAKWSDPKNMVRGSFHILFFANQFWKDLLILTIWSHLTCSLSCSKHVQRPSGTAVKWSIIRLQVLAAMWQPYMHM